MISIGKELKKQRELRGISLEEISNSTKISIRFLKAIEEDNLDILPSGVYRKNFITSYAKYIGINPEDILAFYRNEKEKEAINIPEEKAKGIKYLWAILLIIILIVGLGVYSFNKIKKSYTTSLGKVDNKRMKIKDDKNINEGKKEQIISKGESNSETFVKEDSFEIKIVAIEDSWMEIILENEVAYNWLLRKGEERVFKVHNKITFKKIGNAGGIILYYNNRRLKPLGKKGEIIKDLILSKDVIKEYGGGD